MSELPSDHEPNQHDSAPEAEPVPTQSAPDEPFSVDEQPGGDPFSDEKLPVDEQSADQPVIQSDPLAEELPSRVKSGRSGLIRSIELVALVLLAVVLGIGIGARLHSLQGPFHKLIKHQETGGEVAQARRLVDEHYYHALSQKTLNQGEIQGLIASLHDQFSDFFTPSAYQQFNQLTTDSYVGIGVTINITDGAFVIAAVLPNSPAQAAKVQVGDIITAINGASVHGISSTKLVRRLQGKAGTAVTVTVSDHGKTEQVHVERRAISIPLVETKRIHYHGKLYEQIHLNSFSTGLTAQTAQAIRAAKAAHVQGLVLDLRDNGGGLVNEAQSLCSLFLPNNSLLATLSGLHYARQVLRSSGQPLWTGPLVVLVNDNTASASEITTAALLDDHRAQVVGEKTYGKGIVQSTFPLSNGDYLKLTIAAYLTPDGQSLEHNGIVPAIHAVDNPATSTDEALNAAIKALAMPAKQ